MNQITITDYLCELAEKATDNKKITLEYFDLDKFKDVNIETCYGDLFIICNALDDYARQLDKVIEERDLNNASKMQFEYHSNRCRKISNNLALQMGYDKEKVMKKCLKRKENSTGDVGEDALTLSVKVIKK